MNITFTYFKTKRYYAIAMPFYLMILFLLLTSPIFAQNEYNRIFDIPVEVDEGRQLAFPWMGGLNNPQFSNADLNHDGTKDLFVFDRIGNSIFTFLQKGGAGEIDYEFSMAHQKNFPALEEWSLLVDFDCDGIEDIFTFFDDGIRIYKGRYEEEQMAFELAYDKLYFADENEEQQFIFVSNIDIPTMVDVDNDGDLDILPFNKVAAMWSISKIKHRI